MLREVNLMLIVAGMLIGLLLFNWRLVAATLKALEVRRRIPRGICAGDLLVVNLELTNTRKRLGCWAAVVREEIRCESGAGPSDAILWTEFFPYVPAGQSAAKGYRGRLPQRGRYRFGPVQVSTRFPFGFFSRTITLGGTDTLLVYPRLGQLRRGWITRRHETFEGTPGRQRRHGRVSGNFYGVREWRHGDSRRWIHWRSSARHGTLVVRQFEPHRNRDVAILVDLWQPEEPTSCHLENVELAVSFAATVVADLCRKVGCNLLLCTTSPEPQCVGGPASVLLLEEAMGRLAVARASSSDRLPELLRQALPQIQPGTDVILVSTRAIDMDDTGRFAALWSDPSRRALVRRIRTVNTADGELSEYFQPE